MLAIRKHSGGYEMAEFEESGLPAVVLLMDSEGVIRLVGWPKDGIVVTKATMESFLTHLVAADCLKLPEGEEPADD